MNPVVTVLLSILVFGALILIHELGHFGFARLFKVKINEFSIGMGPRLVYYDSKKSGTRYSLAMFPIGGYVAMAGEDTEDEDPNSFDKKPAWQRFIITVAGASVNIIAGFLAMVIFTSCVNIGGTTVAEFVPSEETGFHVSSYDSGLRVGDEIIKVNNKKVKSADELSYEIMRNGHKPVTLTVIREGRSEVLSDVVFPGIEEEGQTFGAMDFKVYAVKKSFGKVISHSFNKSCLIIRMVWESLYDLVTGRYSLGAVSGPIGISNAIGNAAKQDGIMVLYISALISINLGVMNLLPFPALDGGRLVILLIEIFTRKRLPKKVEGIINGAGLALLLVLSAVIMVKDVITLIF